MANQGIQNDIGFQSEAGNVDFQPESGRQQAGIGERVSEAAQAVNWGKVGVGVGAAAAVAGAAYAAKRYAGRGESAGGGSSGSSGSGRS